MRNTLLAGATFLSVFMAGRAIAQPFDNEHEFSGLYVGVSISRENIIGGSLVDAVDVLAQESRPAVSLFAGLRYEFENAVVLGAELGLAWEDGSLHLAEPLRDLEIDYVNSMHWRYGLTLGVAAGDNQDTLVYAYLSETKRDFDVSIRNGEQQFDQHDGQGLLRFGVGVEHAFIDGGALRASVGSSRANFGRPTNIAPRRPLDVALGLIEQP